jgi:predicted dehydrogenase
MKSCPLTRRGFLQAAGAGMATPYVITSAALGAAGKPPASERITGASIGCGGRGGSITRAAGQLVAVCDPWKDRRELWAERHKCAAYSDFRELLARDDIDVVVIAAPDHWHVPMTVAAAKAGKDIFCEKPLGVSIEEDRLVRDTVHRYGRVFQFGTHDRSSPRHRHAAELVRNGKLGELREVEVHSRGGPTVEGRKGRPAPPMAPVAVPEGLDWDLWLGPAPWRPYNGAYARGGFDWYFVYDFSIGFMAGCGIHPMAQATWGFDTHVHGPFTVEGTGEVGPDPYDALSVWDARVTFANGVVLTHKNAPHDYWRFVGTEGWIDTRGAQPESLLTATLGPDAVRLRTSIGHGDDFLKAVRSRQTTVANIDEAFHADIICQLINIAVRLGRPITWDPVKAEIVGDAEAQRLCCRAMREPWRL